MIRNAIVCVCVVLTTCSGCTGQQSPKVTQKTDATKSVPETKGLGPSSPSGISPENRERNGNVAVPQTEEKDSSSADPAFNNKAGITSTEASFPRTDGAYRSQKRSGLINAPNADVFDYLIFKEGRCYSVSGAYSPNNHHVLHRPARPGTGMLFSEVKSEIADQPRDIQAWLADETANQPFNGPFSLLKNAKLEVRQKFPASHGNSAYELVYICQSTQNGMHVKKKWMSEGVETNASAGDYEFVSFDGPAPEAAPRSEEQVVADRIRELRASIDLESQLAKANSKADRYRQAYRAATGGTADYSRVGRKSQKLAAAEKMLEQYVENNKPLLPPALRLLVNDQSSSLRVFAEKQLSKLESEKLVEGKTESDPRGVSDYQINLVRAALLKLSGERYLGYDMSHDRRTIHRAYREVLRQQSGLEDSRADILREYQEQSEAADKILACLYVLSMSDGDGLASQALRHANKQVPSHILGDSNPQRIAQTQSLLAVGKILQSISENYDSPYSIAATLFLRKEYPFSRSRQLSYETLLSQATSSAPNARDQAIRELQRFTSKSDEILPVLVELERDRPTFVSPHAPATLATLAPHNKRIINLLQDRTMRFQESALAGLKECASVDDEALRAFGRCLAAEPSEFNYDSKAATRWLKDADRWRSTLVLRFRNSAVYQVRQLGSRGEKLLPNLATLLQWRPEAKVYLEYAKLRIDTAITMGELGKPAIPYLQQGLQAGFKEALFGLTLADSENCDKHVKQIVQILQTEEIGEKTRELYYKTLAKLGPKANAAETFLLNEFDNPKTLGLEQEIVETIQSFGPRSAKTIHDRMVQKIKKLRSGRDKSLGFSAQLVSLIGNEPELAFSEFDLLCEILGTPGRGNSEALAVLIDLAKSNPDYRNQIVEALIPYLKREGYDVAIAKKLTKINASLSPDAIASLVETFHRTKRERVKLVFAECLLKTGGHQELISLLDTAIDSKSFHGPHQEKAVALKIEAQRLTSKGPQEAKVDRAIETLQAHGYAKSAFLALEQNRAAAKRAIPLMERSLGNLADQRVAVESAILLLKIAPNHAGAMNVIERIKGSTKVYLRRKIQEEGY